MRLTPEQAETIRWMEKGKRAILGTSEKYCYWLIKASFQQYPSLKEKIRGELRIDNSFPD